MRLLACSGFMTFAISSQGDEALEGGKSPDAGSARNESVENSVMEGVRERDQELVRSKTGRVTHDAPSARPLECSKTLERNRDTHVRNRDGTRDAVEENTRGNRKFRSAPGG